MNRREVLAALGGSLVTLSAGCSSNDDDGDDDEPADFSAEDFKEEYFPGHDELTVITEDEYPDQIEGGHRGAAEDPFLAKPDDHGIMPDRWDDIEDQTSSCGGRMDMALFAELQDQFPDARPQVISALSREFPAELDGPAVYVRYTVMVEDGEAVDEPADDYRGFVRQIPARGHLLDWDDEIFCTMPIYVRQRVREIGSSHE